MTSGITDEIEEARRLGEAIAARHSGSHRSLHSALARTLAIVERCLLDPAIEIEMRKAVAERAEPGRRSYIERGSDAYGVVTRYVFAGSTLANVSRYTIALREAASRQVKASDLIAYLAENGGINGLWLARGVTSDRTSVTLLRLTRSIDIPREGRFTLCLERSPCGDFQVHGDAEG